MVHPTATTEPQIDLLVSSYLHSPKALTAIVLPQFRHRLALARFWQVPVGSCVLDIGCGQGESTLILAQSTGPHGHVVGIDTAPPDYGGPHTVAEAQRHIKQSAYGDRIDFLRTNAANLLAGHCLDPASASNSQRANFDCAVLCHSLWYFGDNETIASLFHDLAKGGIRRVYVADYSYQASLPEQMPHVLASRVQALLHTLKKPRQTGAQEPNVRAAPEPERVVETAYAEGYKLVREGQMIPDADLRDGHYEAKYVQMSLFREHIAREDLIIEAEAEVLGLIPEVKQVYDETLACGHQYTRTMNVWWASFELM